MRRIKLFEEFLAEAQTPQDLHKAYLCIDPKGGQRWWSYKEFAGSKFFVQLTMENYKDIDINPDYPVLNYNSKVCQHLLDEGLIKDENVYNHPKHIKLSGSKAEFHKLVEGEDNIPQTVYTQKAAEAIGLPLIAKPAKGHSGIGIQVFKTDKDWQEADHSKFDIYSQYIDKQSEHRIFNFKGQPWFWMEREPMNDKAKDGSGKGDEQMNFKYIKRDVSKLPPKFKSVLERFCGLMKDLPYMCFDLMEDKQGKVWIIESNAQPGVPYDSTVEAYKLVFQDFFGRDIDSRTKNELSQLAEYMNQKTLELDPGRFEIKDK